MYWHAVFVPLGLFFLWACVSFSWTQDPGGTLLQLVQLAALLMLSFCAAQASRSELRIYILAATVLGGSVAAFIGVLQEFGFNPVGYVQFAAPASTFTNKNFVAIYLDMVVPLALTLVLVSTQTRARWAAALGLGICLSFLVVSGTRGSWLAVAAELVCLGVLARGTLRAIIKARLRDVRLPLAFALSLPVLVSLPIPSGTLSGQYDTVTDRSAQVRVAAYRNALQLIGDYPVTGTGYGAFRVSFRPYMAAVVPIPGADEYRTLSRLHSDPLQLFAELGIPGGLLVLLAYSWIVVLAWRLTAGAADDSTRLQMAGLLMALIAFGTHAWVDFPLQKPASAATFWIILGLVVGSAARATGRRRAVSRPAATAMAVAAIGFLGYNLVFYVNYLRANQQLLVAQEAFHLGQCTQAKEAIARSLQRFGLDFHAQASRVDIYSGCDTPPRERIRVMTEALVRDPASPLARLTRGYAYLRVGQSEGAARDFSVVMHELPQRASGYLGLGHSYHQAGEFAKATAFYRMALQHDPENTAAKVMLARIARTQEHTAGNATGRP